MKEYPEFKEWVVELVRRTSTDLPEDIEAALKTARAAEEPGSAAENALGAIEENIRLSRQQSTPLCQDTGTMVFYVYHPPGFSTREMSRLLTEGCIEATKKYYLRPNAVDSLTNKNSGNGVGREIPSLHFEEWDRDDIWIRLMLKGGGSENCGIQYALPNTALKAGRDLKGVEIAALDAIYRAQGKGCGPGIIGFCVGGDRPSSLAEAKKQHFRKLDDVNENAELKALEERLFEKANKLSIGPMGFGGKTTVLGVKGSYLHRLPACFYVSVSYLCWASRRRDMWIKNGEMKID
jgi:fumarate hydratase class I